VRDYDPETGRWTAKDPILFGGLQANLYSYPNGDPINASDPEGMDPPDTGAGFHLAPGHFPERCLLTHKELKKLAKEVNKILDRGEIRSEKELETLADFLRMLGRDRQAGNLESAY